jgi:tetratricopeptide (TPR) repeat protein
MKRISRFFEIPVTAFGTLLLPVYSAFTDAPDYLSTRWLFSRFTASRLNCQNRFMPRALVLLAISSFAAFGAEQWSRVSTAHFELYTEAGEERARELILDFEQVRSFFTAVCTSKSGTGFPTRIIVFRSEKQFRPYAPNDVTAAYYRQARYRDYLVLGDAEPEHLPAAIHEYMHLLVRQSSLNLPLWLSEGWADVYSTLKPMGRKTLVGDLMPSRMPVLQTQKWMSFEDLTSVNAQSAAYNEKSRAGIFYAESWALVHMLYLAPEYSPKFPSFVNAVSHGKTAGEAFQTAYGRSSAQVYADLQSYLRRNRLFGAHFDVRLTKSEENAEVSQPSAFESDLMLADLLSTINRREQATEAFRRLAAQNPGKPEIPRSMGYLAWQNNDRVAARKQFEKAFAEGGRDPEMCYDMATLETEENRGPDLAVAALKRAVEVKPDYTDAWLQLGLAQLNLRDYKGAIASLQQIRRTDGEYAATLFNALAYGFLQTGNFEEARKQAELARKWDKTEGEKQRTENLLAYLDSRGKTNQAPGKAPGPPSLLDSVDPRSRI